MKFLSQSEAIEVDKELFNDYQYSVDQLMELAGLSVASSIYKTGQINPQYQQPGKILIICGPGNNGGDGLVAARHLKLFGYTPSILYPKPGKSQLFSNLVHQCKQMNIDFLDSNNLENFTIDASYKLIIDAVFGFSYKPPLRPEFFKILKQMAQISSNSSSTSNQKLISIDIPSGWHVENGPPITSTISSENDTPILKPDLLISLTAPKKCSKYFQGNYHWLGGRFIPENLAKKYQLNLPSYKNDDQCLLLEDNDLNDATTEHGKC